MNSPDFWLHVLCWWFGLSFTVFIILCIGAIRNERRNRSKELADSAVENFIRSNVREPAPVLEVRFDSRDTKRLYTRLGR